MNIITIAESIEERAEDELLREEIELQETTSEDLEEMQEYSPTLGDLDIYYLDPNSLTRSATNLPVEIEANDGTKMLTGIIKIDGANDSLEVDHLIEEGLLDNIVNFVNQDYRLNIGKEALITDKLYSGIVNFIVSSGYNRTASSNVRKSIYAAKADIDSKSRVSKATNDFLKKFEIGSDISDFNVNNANQEIHDLLEEVAVNLSASEKRQVKTKIRNILAKKHISLVYLEAA